jgi:tetratricopeptide (TPR) repeat protein
VLGHLEEHEAAREHLEGVVETRRAHLGPTHADTLVARNNLAMTLLKLERFDEAIAIQEGVYADQEATLGPDHLDTLISANDLAAALQRLGRREEAIPWYERASAGMSAQLPAGSMDVVIPKMNLGRLLGELDRHGDARDLLLPTLADAVAGLGNDHFIVAILRSITSEQLLALDDPVGAADLAERSHAVLLDVYGPDNGFTRAAARTLEEARGEDTG